MIGTREARDKFRTTTGRNVLEAAGDYFADELSEHFNPLENPLNVTNYFSAYDALTAGANVAASAIAKTAYEYNPAIFGNDPKNLATALTTFDVLHQVSSLKHLGKAVWSSVPKKITKIFTPNAVKNVSNGIKDGVKKELKDLVVVDHDAAEFVGKKLPATTGSAVKVLGKVMKDQAKFASGVAGWISLADPSSDAEADAIAKDIESSTTHLNDDLGEIISFSNQISAVGIVGAELGADAGLSPTSSTEVSGHVLTISRTATNIGGAIEEAESTAEEAAAQLQLSAGANIDPNDIEANTATTSSSEFDGENGDSQEALNRNLQKAEGNRFKDISQAVGVGKKLYDIAKELQKTVSGVEQLFSSADDDSGYKDPGDDTTYYRDRAQNRTGTPGRNIINTGYKRDIVRSGAGNDRVNTLSGDDDIFAGEGRNSVFAGPGDDFIEDKSGSSFLSAGPGMDTIEPGAGNDAIEAGTGHDKIVYRGRDVGNDLLIDPSRSGELRFVDFGIEEIRLRKDKYDLEIILSSDTGLTSNSVKFVSYFEHDAAGWEIIDKLGNHYSLYELTGRITSYEALQTAYGDRGASSTPVYPADVVHLRSISDASGRLTMHVAEDRRLIGANSTLTVPNLMVTFEGDSAISGWLSRNGVGSLSAANDLLSRFSSDYSYDTISVVGVGEGGLAAQWFAAVAATRGSAFVNSQLINTPDISGLISQVIRSDVEETVNGESNIIAQAKAEYVAGFPNLATNYLVNPADWVSRIGLWAGNDELYATWKAWTFDSDPDSGNTLRDLEVIQAAHDPRSQAGLANFDNLQISDMDLTHVRGVVSFLSVNDLSGAYGNVNVVLDGEEFDSTVNARLVLTDSDVADEDFDLQEDTKADRAAFLDQVQPDPTAVDEDNGFSLKIDFQASSQQREHLAEGHHEATEDTGYSDGAYGWASTDGVKEGKDKGKATSLERDSVKVKNGTFLVDLDPQDQGTGPGTYNVTVTLGDREEIQESLQIYVNGYQADRVSTMPGDFQTLSYQVSTLDSQLRISFVDFGGQHEYFSVNGLSVEKVNYRSFIQASDRPDNDPSITILTQSYELPESNAAIEIFKTAVYAVGTTALTFGAGALLSFAHLPAIASGLGGAFAAGGSFATTASTTVAAVAAKTMTVAAAKKAIISSLASSLGKQALSTAGWSLVSSVPQNFVSDPAARGILAGVTSIGFGAKGIFDAGQPIEDVAGNILDPRDVLGQVKGGLKVLNGSLTVANTIVASARGQLAENNTAPWIYEATATLAEMSQRYRLGRLDAAFAPVDLDDVSNAIANGKTGKKLLKHWQGSRDFLVLDWAPKGVELPDVRVGDHSALVNRGARALKKLIEAYVDVLHENNPEAELDLLLVSHGAGYDINRELVTRLNTSEIADALDYVKLTTLDPVSFNERTGSWYHPEMTNIVDRVDNFFQTETKDQSTGDLEHIGRPLDGRIGGGSAGFYNRQARIFDLESTEELLRFRHWDSNEINLSTAELTDIEFSPDGSLVAASGKDGIVTVRYVESVPNPDDPEGPLLAAGTEKFIVWGQEAIVRSLAFIQIEVDGEWKDYLLTISAARNPENTDIDKNKVLLTDIETGLPVWQGLDVRGTQVEASPSGKILVSTDADGWAKVWRLDEESVTYTSIGRVEAHPGSGGSYITDVYVINDKYFVTAGGQTNRVKVFEVTEDGAKQVDVELFDNPGEGRVRNLDYDPYNGILAVASGKELSLWNFDRDFGQLTPFTADGRSTTQKFTRQDHVAAVQGVSFSKPAFLLNEDGLFSGDRTITLADGSVLELPRHEEGDIEVTELRAKLTEHGLPDSFHGLKLLTGGEDRTLFLYSLDELDREFLSEESVLSGSMLPIREVTLSPDGRRVAVVGQDNIDGNEGGPVKDRDLTSELDDELGWTFSEFFLQGRREHNALPSYYVEAIVAQSGEPFHWLRNSRNANRPGSIDKAHNLALPPNKRDNVDGVDVAPINLYLRPGRNLEIKPLHYLLEVNREDYQVTTVISTPVSVEARDTSGNLILDDANNPIVIGEIRNKKVDGKIKPNIFVFTASDDLDYSDPAVREYVGTYTINYEGPEDLDGVKTTGVATVNFRVINHRPIAYRDVITLHPGRKELDFRPRKNDYDFDNDDFVFVSIPNQKQSLNYNGTEVATIKRAASPEGYGVDVEVTIEEAALRSLLEAAGKDSISVEFPYQVREKKHKALGEGVLEIRLQLQEGPGNVRYSDLGADRVVINWDPVTWNADKYVIQRFDETQGTWVKHATNSDVDGRNADSKTISIDPEVDEYWFRVVAKNDKRDVASFDETDASGNAVKGGLRVVPPPYVGPEKVELEVLGSNKVQVTWDKVFWNVAKYQIQLRKLVLDDAGQLIPDPVHGYQYDPGSVKNKELSVGEGRTWTFKNLEADRSTLPL